MRSKSIDFNWTSRNVVAIDPAELNDDVRILDNVRHLQCKAEDALPLLPKFILEQRCDILVCDMNHHPLDVVEIIR